MIFKECKRLVEERRDCCWPYVVTNGSAGPKSTPIRAPARLNRRELMMVQHYTVATTALNGEVGRT